MRRPTIEWQVAGACNYDCSYCIQSPRYRRGRPKAEKLELALQSLAALPGTWEIKCSGGEAFAHPLFLAQVVPGLMGRTPHRISVLTNFSASRRDLMRFASLTQGRLVVFSASLHLEFVAPEAWMDKLSWFRDLVAPDVRLVINQVVLPGRLDEAERCRDLAEERDLRWFPQLYKHDGTVDAYPGEEERLTALIGPAPGPRQANTAPSYRGRRCWAGVDYFTVDKDGRVWSCRTAKRHDQGKLGNLYDGTLQLLPGPAPCPWDICPCTVPANRGMIEGVQP